ncbi:hypothetical protein BKA61DRAFT_703359 [Leptodontidium sp. MPI-SDFR-AT-0119]|nr:hypothetical protein BKA61DRAFT_703359 [Leptodontidium sp. MPI-SDFR-AT-0119]
MLKFFSLLVSFFAIIVALTLVIAQTSLPLPATTDCLAPVTFGSCMSLQAKVLQCQSIQSSNSADYVTCFCTQEVFSAITDCESETRMCARSPNNDHYYIDLRQQWLQACGPKITFAPTTPVLSNFAFGTFSDLSCTEIAIPACQSLQFLASQCSMSFTDYTDSQFYSCACQSEIVSQASLCEIFGSSCLGHIVTTSTLFIYSHCGFGRTSATSATTALQQALTKAPKTSTSTPNPSSPGITSAVIEPTTSITRASSTNTPTSSTSIQTGSRADASKLKSCKSIWTFALILAQNWVYGWI